MTRTRAGMRILALVMLTPGGAVAAFSEYAKCEFSVTLFDADNRGVPVLHPTFPRPAPIDTYVEHFNYVAAGTGRIVNHTAGQSLLEVKLAVNPEPNGAAFSTTSHIHSTRCETKKGGSHFLYDVAGVDGGDNLLTAEHNFPGGILSSTGHYFLLPWYHIPPP